MAVVFLQVIKICLGYDLLQKGLYILQIVLRDFVLSLWAFFYEWDRSRPLYSVNKSSGTCLMFLLALQLHFHKLVGLQREKCQFYRF